MLSQKLKDKVVDLAMASLDLPQSTKLHFSFVVNKNRILSYGFNNGYRSHPIAARYNCRFNATHSELMAIQRFPYPIAELAYYDLVNVRIRRDNKRIALAKPCDACVKMLNVFSPRQIYFSTNFGDFNLL